LKAEEKKPNYVKVKMLHHYETPYRVLRESSCQFSFFFDLETKNCNRNRILAKDIGAMNQRLQASDKRMHSY
jgi:hypothetical protein